MATGAALSQDARLSVTVYAGSRREVRADHERIARELGTGIARRGWVLVYGGANVGLMGACANAALEAGGRVEGVILDTFSRVAHAGLHELETVTDMRSRKAGLAHRGDAFAALPGGFGTLEEVSEILVERQLERHAKPLVLVSPDGFRDPLLGQFERMAAAGLLRQEYLRICSVVPDAPEALKCLEAPASSAPAAPDKWS